MSYWREVSKCDRFAISFAAPHYSIAKPLSAELGPPGQKIVLFGDDCRALWGSHRPAPWAKLQRMDGFKGHSCFIFRNDGGPQSSEIIREAVAITAMEWNLAPFITYVAIDKVKRKRDPGRCFIKAGFRKIGRKEKTKHGPMLRFEMEQQEVMRCVQDFLRPAPNLPEMCPSVSAAPELLELLERFCMEVKRMDALDRSYLPLSVAAKVAEALIGKAKGEQP